MNEGKKRVVVIGSGPAGLTAALYTARAQLPTTVITGPLLGGQIATTHEVENYPGFPDGTTGPELVEAMRAQAERFGTEFVYDSVARAQLTEGLPFRIETQGGETHEADAVIVTIGANPRALGIPGEAEYVGHGVSYCATCDGFFFRGKDVVVVGGGDSALQEALFLTRFANRVDVIHRRDELRASVALQTRALAHEKIHFIWDTVVDEIRANGGGAVHEILTRNLKSGERQGARSTASSSSSATTPTATSSRASWPPTRPATCSSTSATAVTSRASSPPARSTTRSSARRSRPPVTAAPPP